MAVAKVNNRARFSGPSEENECRIIHHPKRGTCMRLKEIKFAPRPASSEEPLAFFNPRPEEEVNDPAKSDKLRYNLRIEGLIQPPVIRVWTDPNNPDRILRNSHIAGERRLRRLNEIYDQKLLCADYENPKPTVFKAGSLVVAMCRFGKVIKQVKNAVTILFDGEEKETSVVDWELVAATISGDKAFETIQVAVHYDISDQQAMRIAFSENDQSEPLSTRAEILLVERYMAMRPKPTLKEIAYILSSNITFVSQRASFRKELPEQAFEKLMSGEMAANVAVTILGRPRELREEYFSAMIADEKKSTEEIIRRYLREQEEHEDAADLHQFEADKAAKLGDEAVVEREKKRAAAATAKAATAHQKSEQAKASRGKITGRHASHAHLKTGIAAKRGSMLSREQIDEIYIKGMLKYLGDDEVLDEVTGQPIPKEAAAITRRIAKAINDGNIDFASVIREYYVENGLWTLDSEEPPEEFDPSVEDEDEEEFQEDEDEDEVELDEESQDDFDPVLGEKMWN
jgi:hypothetical protein